MSVPSWFQSCIRWEVRFPDVDGFISHFNPPRPPRAATRTRGRQIASICIILPLLYMPQLYVLVQFQNQSSDCNNF